MCMCPPLASQASPTYRYDEEGTSRGHLLKKEKPLAAYDGDADAAGDGDGACSVFGAQLCDACCSSGTPVFAANNYCAF